MKILTKAQLESATDVLYAFFDGRFNRPICREVVIRTLQAIGDEVLMTDADKAELVLHLDDGGKLETWGKYAQFEAVIEFQLPAVYAAYYRLIDATTNLDTVVADEKGKIK